MGLIQDGSLRLFRVAGIDVFLHWTWLLMAAFEVSARQGEFSNPIWNLVEYVSLFAIVLLHEFGHAFACRSVGGAADRIMLWPLGGIAFVSPPPRPGAVLWSIAAGPLVNVALIPILGAAWILAMSMGLSVLSPDAVKCLGMMNKINALLLIFNILPFYPLDGGQIVQSLLWFAVGRGKSMVIAGWIGTLAGGAFLALALLNGQLLFAVLAFFLMTQAWNGVRIGRFLQQLAKLPRREGLRCPFCGEAPVVGEFWPCESCQQPFDMFANHGFCPHCGHQAELAPCPHCGRSSRLDSMLHDSEEAQARLV